MQSGSVYLTVVLLKPAESLWDKEMNIIPTRKGNKTSFSKENVGRAGITVSLHGFQLSSFFLISLLSHLLNLQSIFCWFSYQVSPYLNHFSYSSYLPPLEMLLQDSHHILKPHWNPTLKDADILNYCLHWESEINQSQKQGLNSQVSVFPICKAIQTTIHLDTLWEVQLFSHYWDFYVQYFVCKFRYYFGKLIFYSIKKNAVFYHRHCSEPNSWFCRHQFESTLLAVIKILFWLVKWETCYGRHWERINIVNQDVVYILPLLWP